MILLIDNFDSFTYNIFQFVRRLGHDVVVKRNNAVTLEDVHRWGPSQIIISPGPGRPESAGTAVEIVRHFKGKIPILGICLGHQCIGQAFGGEIVRAPELFHGKSSEIYHDGNGIFSGIKNPFRAIRYHSLVIKKASLPEELEISAWTDEGDIMGIRHKMYSLEGVQFHPESIGTESGLDLLANFLSPRPNPSLIQSAIRKVYAGSDLDEGEAEKVMGEITSGRATAAQMASFLTALGVKGESVSELTGFARVMRRKAVQIAKPKGRIVVDTCGTGGDASGTFNISTCAAFIAAGAGVSVAKHGNRSVTSRCGSADLLEALGINITAPSEVMEKALEEIGIAFLFAPKLHLSMKHAVPVRTDMGIRTVFNILGPMANPAGAECQIIGVFSESIMEKMARALIRLGVSRAMVVHGCDGLDEITLTGPTKVVEVNDGWIKTYVLNPQDYGFSCCSLKDLKGGDLKANCEIVMSILEGKRGPQRDVAVINAAAAISISGKAGSFSEALRMAEESIDSGAALRKMDDLIAFSIREGL
ncbi:MAG: bifunctional anthranilate synthase component II/anthranilate phosphoribosyltransferase [Candidatus Aminicenantales bacterium]